PLLGGLLVSAVSWRAIFVINLPLGIFVALLANRHVPETRDPDASGRIDYLGATLAAIGLGGTTYALIEGGSGWTAAVALAGVGGVLALVGFIFAEKRSP